MAIINRRFRLILVLVSIILLLSACGETENKNADNTVANKSSIFVCNDGIEISYESLSANKNIEINLSEQELKTLVDALAAYDGKWLDDPLKLAVSSGYLIRFDEDTYVRIGAEDHISSKDGLVYMWVADQGKYKDVYIDSSIIAPLEAQRAKAE